MTARRAIRGETAVSCAWLLTLLLIAAGAVTTVGRWCWPCDLVSHFPAQLAVAGLVTSVAFAAVGRLRGILVPAAVAAWSIAALVPFYAGMPATSAASTTATRVIRVVAMNVAVHNHDAPRVIRFIRATKPDILIVAEVNDFWVTALAEVAVDFPFRRLEPGTGHLGVGLMSRLPLIGLDDHPAGRHAVVARLAEPRLTIVGTHTVPPFTPWRLVRRNRQLAEIAAFVRSQREPVVVAGDLNSSSWSAGFQDLLRGAGLRDTRLGRGVQPTWPAWLPLAQVPIDHVLASAEVRVHACVLDERVGSDHLPVVVDLSVDEAPIGR
jgi:endonuclease/exonuclease/phosphatase (EEP) superfamily protein YafD